MPPPASTPKTAAQPEQDSHKRRPPFGNKTSTGTLPCAAAALGQTNGNLRLVDPLEMTSADIEIACRHPALFVGVSRPGPACEGQCQLKRFG